MKSQYNLTELATELERRAAAKQDFIANTEQVTMTDDAQLSFQNGSLHQFEANDVAHSQIASRLEIPAKYYNRMKAHAPEMLAKNVNHWLHAKPETRMIRTLDGEARAFLSDKYQRIENEEIAATVLPILLDAGQDVKIQATAITSTRMYIKATFPGIQGEVRVGDVVEAGIAISNSEVGMGMVKIEPLIHRLVCLNGAVINDAKFAMRHVGSRIKQGDDVYELMSDEAIKADDKALMLKVRDVVRASFDQERFNGYLKAMRESTEDKITGDVVESVKMLSKKNSLNDFEQGGVLRHLIEGGDLSRWGMLNAVTRTAQDVESYDRSHELETLGGNILTLPRSDWRVLAEAA